ncbi:hypothetical protein L1987_74394 [Smallanthus sonchifolius]|uniref:Uncharacterized protein n=1 Tax=Smallanthus sonchifolius TaxID=185202 RepID=A0ACB9A2J2_9ASTR|nr:hypothetical protein L1987_74394 [Smallanthus sonchifolius]
MLPFAKSSEPVSNTRNNHHRFSFFLIPIVHYGKCMFQEMEREFSAFLKAKWSRDINKSGIESGYIFSLKSKLLCCVVYTQLLHVDEVSLNDGSYKCAPSKLNNALNGSTLLLVRKACSVFTLKSMLKQKRAS